MIKKISKILLIILTMFLCFALGVVYQKTSKLEFIGRVIDAYFPLEYDKDKIEEAGARAMVNALGDPHSIYMDRDELQSFFSFVESEQTGIGVLISYNNGAVIKRVIENSPAEKAGLKEGDIVLSVDEMEITTENYNDIISYITGQSENSPKGEMCFKIKRGNEVSSYYIKRGVFYYPVVEEADLGDGIYYIWFGEFSDHGVEDLKKALENTKDKKGLILDLRGNPGGTVDAVTEVASEFLGEGLLFYSVDGRGKREDVMIKDNDYTDIPLVVITDGDSASASEVLSAAIKEKGRGLLIGQTTYGKGLVQTVVPFRDGTGMKITIAKYYTSKGNYIDKVGIEPDIFIEDVTGNDPVIRAKKELSGN